MKNLQDQFSFDISVDVPRRRDYDYWANRDWDWDRGYYDPYDICEPRSYDIMDDIMDEARDLNVPTARRAVVTRRAAADFVKKKQQRTARRLRMDATKGSTKRAARRCTQDLKKHPPSKRAKNSGVSRHRRVVV